MPEYIVFRTKDWPEVIRRLRCQYQWPESSVEDAINQALDESHRPDPDPVVITGLLEGAALKCRPHPENPGRWAFSVDVAESLAADVVVVESTGERTAVQKAALVEMHATSAYRPTRSEVLDDEERQKLRLLADERRSLNGMKAAS